jgi:hypothetical protein
MTLLLQYRKKNYLFIIIVIYITEFQIISKVDWKEKL